MSLLGAFSATSNPIFWLFWPKIRNFNFFDFLAPELVDGLPITPAHDYWCLGVLIYEMLTGVTPFACHNDKKTKKFIKTLPVFYGNKVGKNIPPSLRDLVSTPKHPKKGPKSAKKIQKIKIFEQEKNRFSEIFGSNFTSIWYQGPPEPPKRPLTVLSTLKHAQNSPIFRSKNCSQKTQSSASNAATTSSTATRSTPRLPPRQIWAPWRSPRPENRAKIFWKNRLQNWASPSSRA